MRADRLLSLLMLLQSKGRMTARSLAQELEVSERTIYRDVMALGVSGVPVITEPGPGGGISLMDHYRSDLTGLTGEEVQALFMLSIPAPLMDLGLDRQLKDAYHKLSAALPMALRGDEQSVRQRIHIDNDGWEQSTGNTPHLVTLQQAVWHTRKLEIEYRSQLGGRVGPLVAEIDPYGLVAKAGAWYLVAFRGDHFAVLQVEYIMRAAFQGTIFEREPDFDLVSFWQAWCMDNQERRPQFAVTVRVSAALRPYLVRFLGETVAMGAEGIDKGEEAGWSKWRLMFSSFDDARGRILALGRAVEVLEPRALRLSVIDFAEQIADSYKEDHLL